MTANVINIEDAKLRTLSIEIKAVTVSGKQMTQSTFRQIVCDCIFTKPLTGDFSLIGVPWGWVNYSWGRDNSDDQIWVLWQSGRELRRSVHYLADDPSRWLKPEYSIDERIAILERRMKMVPSKSEIAELESLRTRLKAIQEHNAMIKSSYKMVSQAIESLPQLFIAV